MQTQTVFQAGNSPYVVAIPKSIAEEMRFKRGEKIVVDKMDEDTVVIRRVKKSKVKKDLAKREFDKWWDTFIQENKEILDELAVR